MYAHAAPKAEAAGAAGALADAAAPAAAAGRTVPPPRVSSSVRVRSARAAAAAATAKLLQPSPVMHVCNYPPSDLSSFTAQAAGQQFYWSPVAWQIGLLENCRLLHTRVAASRVRADGRAGLGLFATQAFAEGATLGYMWGRFATQDEWDSIVHRGVELRPYHSARLGELAEDFVAPVQQGIHRCLAVPDQEHGATLLMASEQCPMAYMNHGDSAAVRNVRIAVPATAFSCRDQPAYQYVPCVVCTSHGRGIAKGDEILTTYEWATADLAKLTARFARQPDARSIVLAEYAAHAAAAAARSGQNSSSRGSSWLTMLVRCSCAVCHAEASRFVGPSSSGSRPTRMLLLMPLLNQMPPRLHPMASSARVGRTSKPAVSAPPRQQLAAVVSPIRRPSLWRAARASGGASKCLRRPPCRTASASCRRS